MRMLPVVAANKRQSRMLHLIAHLQALPDEHGGVSQAAGTQELPLN